ncbi:MAG: BON domain-containing protein [Candidatus Rokuibacteriota bacterium]
MTATATVIALAFAAPTGVSAADDKKSTTESMKTTVSDSWLTSKTKIALFADSRAPGSSVNVETKNGMVYLRGKVESAAEKQAAEEIARGIEGVQAVRNELQVVPGSAKRIVDVKDDEITQQVKNRFERDPKLKSVDVRTDNGVVTLRGRLPNITDSARASQMAREVPGVRAVRNDTTYDNPKVSLQSDRPARADADVRMAQEKLKDKGFDPGPVDGIWGPRTADAVGEYQGKENMTVTKRLDGETRAKLALAPSKPQTP